MSGWSAEGFGSASGFEEAPGEAVEPLCWVTLMVDPGPSVGKTVRLEHSICLKVLKYKDVIHSDPICHITLQKKIISNTLTIDKPIHQCLYNKRFLTQCTLKSFILQLTLRNLLLPWLYMSISRVMHCISVKSLRLLSLSLVRSST